MNGPFCNCCISFRVLALVGLTALTSLSSKAENPNGSAANTESEASLLQEALSIQIVSEFDARKVRDPSKWRWVCYDSDGRHLEERVVEKSKLGLRRVPKSGPVAILYDTASGVAYWRWTTPEPKQLFEDEEYVDLQTLCFGPDPRISETWARLHPDREVRYEINSRLGSLVKSGGVLSCSQIADFLSEDGLQTVGAKIRTTRTALDREERAYQNAMALGGIYDAEDGWERKRSEYADKLIEGVRAELRRETERLRRAANIRDRRKRELEQKEAKERIAELNLRLVELSKKKDADAESSRQARESRDKIASLRATLRKLEREEELYSDLPKLRALVRETVFAVSVKTEGESQP